MDERSILFTDRYCLSMAQKFWRNGENDLVSFEMFFRKLPPNRGYMIQAGVGTLLWWLERLTVEKRDYNWLRDNGFDPGFADYLWSLSHDRPRFFSGDVYALPEGTPLGPGVPLVRITASRIEATLIESMLLSIMNHQIMVASKVSRIVEAARGRPVYDFSLRRLHGPEAGIGVARAAYLAGAAGTATVEADIQVGIPTIGTMAHHAIMMYGPDGEIDAYADFLIEFPDNHALLVDTYDTLRGVERAMAASYSTGIPLKAIRLDSGDLAFLSREARKTLDEAGTDFTSTKIFASNDLDEYSINSLLLGGAPIDAFGVGTMLGTVPDAPNVGGVYKLVEQHEREPRYVMKLSEGKANDPGAHNVFADSNGELTIGFDWELELGEEYHQLMKLVMDKGRSVLDVDLEASRRYCRLAVENLLGKYRTLQQAPDSLPVHRTYGVWARREALGDKTATEQIARLLGET
jgi:nicotinate phosphoribosyltransferase